jgi:hypothetical protein
MLKAIKIRLYLNNEQENIINRLIGSVDGFHQVKYVVSVDGRITI